jgi:linoleoyl-CoA desaturase
LKKKGSVKFTRPEPSQFYPTLKMRVDDYFNKNNLSPNANRTMVVKSIVMISAYLIPLAALIIFNPPFSIALLLWVLMGVAMAGIGMSVMHDALHGAYTSNKRLNFMIGSVINMIGGSIFNWKLQHNILHHTYTNVYEMDDDIDEKLILRFTEHSSPKKVHKYQWWYAFMFYGITTLYWVVAKDFVQYYKYKNNGVNNQSPAKNRVVLFKLILLKLIYFGFFIAMPLFAGIPALQLVAGFLLMHFVCGLILTITFQLAHTVEGTTHPLPNEKGVIEQDWAIHQMESTVNFAPHNKLLNWYVGGLNFQVEHHLFPRISHVHYPAIAPIVKATAEEFGVPYLCNPTIGGAILSHVRLLKQLGYTPDLNEAMG